MDRRVIIAVTSLLLWAQAPQLFALERLQQQPTSLVARPRVTIPLRSPSTSVQRPVAVPRVAASIMRLPMPREQTARQATAPLTLPQARLHYPETNPSRTALIPLPDVGPAVDPRLANNTHDVGIARGGSARNALRRRYPATMPLDKQQPQSEVLAPPTYRWEPGNPNLVAVADRAQRRIDAGFKLAHKGAMYGARAEFRTALLIVAEALDARHGVTSHSQAIHAAWRAMREAADFANDEGAGPGRVAQIAESHQTPVLETAPSKGMPPLRAMQQYYAFAQDRLTSGCGGAPVASKALYALGKLYMALGDTEQYDQQQTAQAMTFLQAAILVDANNFAAANELGVMLARCGQLPEAREVLRHSARIQPTPETWKNLEVVHQRLGEAELAERARREWQRAEPTDSTVAAGSVGTVQWVTPEAFSGSPPGTRPAPVAQAVTADKSTGFSLWPWH